MEGNRNVVFDIVKGVGILLVIIGHLSHGYGIAPFIYVFHMPLFFMVSGYFYRSKKPLVLLKRDIRLLLLPYGIVFFLTLAYGVVMALMRQDIDKFTYWWTENPGTRLPEAASGPLWFLLAMFWCRMFYNLLSVYVIKDMSKRKNMLSGGVMVFLVFIVTTKLIPHDYNFACILAGLSAMLFYMIGHVAKLCGLHVPGIVSVLFVALGFFFLYLSADEVGMEGMKYNHMLINVFAAVSVTYFVYLVCARFKETKVGEGLAWLGRYSIVAFCVHTLMYRIVPWEKALRLFLPSGEDLIVHGGVTLLHIAISIAFCMLVERTKVLRVVFSIK